MMICDDDNKGENMKTFCNDLLERDQGGQQKTYRPIKSRSSKPMSNRPKTSRQARSQGSRVVQYRPKSNRPRSQKCQIT